MTFIRQTRHVWCCTLFCAFLFAATSHQADAQQNSATTVSIGSRVEMFVDNWLIESKSTRAVSLKLHPPIRKEVVLTTDKPWEGKESAYFTVLQDGPIIRLYYRGFIPPGGDASEKQVTCYAESKDGVHFTRPNLGLYEFNGSRENNIVYMGVEAHNFAPFLDTNPKAKPEERYKAVGGLESRLFGFTSPDGLRWNKVKSEPLITKGQFDSLNVVFRDEQEKLYRCYSRVWTGGGYNGFRAVQSSTSDDFFNWNDPVPNRHHAADGSEPPSEHFYTSATTFCPGAPHHLLSFPMRFIPDRTIRSQIKDKGMSDAVFLSSRNGTNWNRTFLEAWVRPGLDERNWTHRNNMPAHGIVQTSSNEFSMYISEHYAWPDNRLRRLSIRRHGFGSMHAGATPGEFTTRPLLFTGKTLLLNYATSAAGSVQVEVQDEQGKVLPGFSLADMNPMFGDELEGAVRFRFDKDVSDFEGIPVRLRFVLKDADLYSLKFE